MTSARPHLVSCPDRRSSPRVKRSGAPSRIPWAYSWNVVKTNEIAGFVIITFWNAIRNNKMVRFSSGLDELAVDAVLYAA